MSKEEIEIIEIDDVKHHKKNHKKKKQTKGPSKKLIITFIVLDLFAVVGLFLTYGPISYFRDFLVTTAMRTQNHRYLAHIFYGPKTITEILNNNYTIEVKESTDTTEIVIGDNEDTGVYESIYEEQILKRDPNHPEYKVIDLKGTNYMGWKYKGYLVAIYDPSRVDLAVTNKLGVVGQRLRELTKQNNALVGINASGFADPNDQGNGGQPAGTIIKDGEIIWEGTGVRNLAGFNNDNVLVLTKQTPQEALKEGMRDAVEFGPFLIVNGKQAYVKGDGGWGIHPRTALAQRKDGIVLFLVIDGRQPGYSLGADLLEVIKIFNRYRAHNAVNLDGGASSALVVNNELYSKPCAYNATGERWLPNAWILK